MSNYRLPQTGFSPHSNISIITHIRMIIFVIFNFTRNKMVYGFNWEILFIYVYLVPESRFNIQNCERFVGFGDSSDSNVTTRNISNCSALPLTASVRSETTRTTTA